MHLKACRITKEWQNTKMVSISQLASTGLVRSKYDIHSTAGLAKNPKVSLYMYSCRIAFLYFCLFLLILIPCFCKFRIAYFSLYTSI